MTSNQWDNRASSGFYTLIEDEMFGKGRRNVDTFRKYPNTIIRRYGSIWEPYEDAARVRMYLYEPVEFGDNERDLLKVDNALKTILKSKVIKEWTNITLQHHFAEDDGTIRDFVQVWANNDTPLFQIDDKVVCVKLLRVIHFFEKSETPFDYHVKIALA